MGLIRSPIRSVARSPSLTLSQGGGASFRADASNADAANIIPVTGAAQFSTTTREVYYSQHDFNQLEVTIPLFTFSTSGSILEIPLVEAYDFAPVVEYPFHPGLTGIPTNTRYRLTVPETGLNVFSYTVGGQVRKVAKFIATLPFTIPAHTAYGGILTHECVAGRSGAVTDKQIMKAQQGSNNTQRYQGYIAVSYPTAGHISTDAAMTLTAFNQYSSTKTGGNVPMGFGAIAVPSAKSVVTNGNSIEAGNQEGYGASGIYGDASGDQYGNRGWAMRLLWALGIGCAQISKGSDRDAYRNTANNYGGRSDFLAAANPTHIIDMNPHNEIASGIVSAIARPASTSVAQWSSYIANGNGYIVLTGGVTAAGSGPTSTAAGPITDGQAIVEYVGPDDITDSAKGIGWVAGRKRRLVMDRAAAPSAKIIGVTCPPDADCVQTSTTYSYVGTTLTITLADVSTFIVGVNARVQGLTPSGLNSPSNGFSAVTAVDLGAKTVSFTVASGLAAPTGTASVRDEWIASASQVPASGYTPGTSSRTWINRFLRSQQAIDVLGYIGIIDLGKYTETGNPVTIGAENGTWENILETGTPVGGAPTYDKTHPTSYNYQRVADRAAADPAVQALFA